MSVLPAGTAADLLQLLTQAERLLSRRVAGILHEEGCSAEAWRVLHLLAEGGGRPMTEVADRSFLPPGTLTKVVDQLVELGLVYRRIDPADRRRIRAFLAPRGRQLQERIAARIEASVTELPVPGPDREHLAALLHGLSQAMTATPVAA
ncbi:MarR family transcriptional regulator [Catellatospora sp. KI3]|uniref:MarR family winged helix-turn-helix transcriptional regulator n=1 Tax=Catellatospora sp. KI3 TaxID=3041620 RepID=UPI002482CB15|nr:MarR family transcriptional regulator [Catellatospora sp. KI3]MDI1464764.1 MarR family transcriptional regulator [Catellatospora sp. KI3]